MNLNIYSDKKFSSVVSQISLNAIANTSTDYVLGFLF